MFGTTVFSVFIVLFFLILLGFLVAFLFKIFSDEGFRSSFWDPVKAEGNRGERWAAEVISSVLREDDHLFTNVQISYDGKDTELDNVVVNKCGVFIIEVKSYWGRLYGGEDDYEWTKEKVSGGGYIYEKTVKNPIKQVKRQVYILAKYLEYYGASVWVEGNVIIRGAKSPVKSEIILNNTDDIDKAIHSRKKNGLNEKMVEKVCGLLSK